MNVCNGATSCIHYIKIAEEKKDEFSVQIPLVFHFVPFFLALWLHLLAFNDHLMSFWSAKDNTARNERRWMTNNIFSVDPWVKTVLHIRDNCSLKISACMSIRLRVQILPVHWWEKSGWWGWISPGQSGLEQDDFASSSSSGHKVDDCGCIGYFPCVNKCNLYHS